MFIQQQPKHRQDWTLSRRQNAEKECLHYNLLIMMQTRWVWWWYNTIIGCENVDLGSLLSPQIANFHFWEPPLPRKIWNQEITNYNFTFIERKENTFGCKIYVFVSEKHPENNIGISNFSFIYQFHFIKDKIKLCFLSLEFCSTTEKFYWHL